MTVEDERNWPEDEPSDECFCGGDSPGWEYHGPEGCAKTAQAYNMVSGMWT